MIKLLIREDVMHTMAALNRAEKIYRRGGGPNVDVPPQLNVEPKQTHDVRAHESAVLSVVAVRQPQKSSIKL